MKLRLSFWNLLLLGVTGLGALAVNAVTSLMGITLNFHSLAGALFLVGFMVYGTISQFWALADALVTFVEIMLHARD